MAPRGPYPTDRFGFGTDESGRPISFRPKEILVRYDPSDGALEDFPQRVNDALGDSSAHSDNLPTQVQPLDAGWLLLRATEPGRFDPIRAARLLRAKGIPAQPNHIYFVDSLRRTAPPDATVDPNMFAPNMFAPNMFAPNMFAPNMFAPNMFAPNMFAGLGSHPLASCGCRDGVSRTDGQTIPHLRARPVEGPQLVIPELKPDDMHIEVHVLDVRSKISQQELYENQNALTDTGGCMSRDEWAQAIDRLKAVKGGLISKLHDLRARIDQTRTRLSPDGEDLLTASFYGFADEPVSAGLGTDTNGDGVVDPVTGHGRFIASIIQRIAGDIVHTHGVAGTLGDVDDAELSEAMAHLREVRGGYAYRILNLSLSGYNEDDRPSMVLADAITRMQDDDWLIVASAGNQASCRLAWPAALEGVVAVAAIGDCAPAWFSSFGPWVDACAPGVDIVSEFPVLDDHAIGRNAVGDDWEARDFCTGWARWSGTSFAAPFVAAQLAVRMMRDFDPTGTRSATDAYQGAIAKVIEDPNLPRIPHYGTVVKGG